MNKPKQPLKVLFIASEFPPVKQNVARTTKFIKYLDRNCCKPYVLTINIKSMEGIDHTYDKEIPEDLKIYRAYFPNIFANGHAKQRSYLEDLDKYSRTGNKVKKSLLWLKLLLRRRIPGAIRNYIQQTVLIPDLRMPWIPFAVVKGIRVCRKENIDIVYSSVPWFSNHIVAWIIKSVLKKKWVADYRDLWTTTLYRNFGSRWREKLEKAIERKCVDKMDAILVVTDTMKSILLKKYPEISENKIKVIPNGYDPNDFKNITDNSSRDIFTVSYTGVIYPSYTLDHLLYGLGDLIKEHPSVRSEIKVLIIGSIDGNERTSLTKVMQDRDLNDVVSLEGIVSREEALKSQRNSSLLILRISEKMAGSGAVSSKLYDYWAAERPVLALVPPDSLAAEYVIISNSGRVVDPSDSESIKNALWDYYQEFKSGSNTYHPDKEFIRRFDRRELAKQLSAVLTSISRYP